MPNQDGPVKGIRPLKNNDPANSPAENSPISTSPLIPDSTSSQSNIFTATSGQKQIICPYCSSLLPAGSSICKYCGNPILITDNSPSALSQTPCPKCGCVNPPNSSYCMRCGTSLTKSQTSFVGTNTNTRSPTNAQYIYPNVRSERDIFPNDITNEKREKNKLTLIFICLVGIIGIIATIAVHQSPKNSVMTSPNNLDTNSLSSVQEKTKISTIKNTEVYDATHNEPLNTESSPEVVYNYPDEDISTDNISESPTETPTDVLPEAPVEYGQIQIWNWSNPEYYLTYDRAKWEATDYDFLKFKIHPSCSISANGYRDGFDPGTHPYTYESTTRSLSETEFLLDLEIPKATGVPDMIHVNWDNYQYSLALFPDPEYYDECVAAFWEVMEISIANNFSR